MPISLFRLSRLLIASGLLMLATFASARAQESPLDPNLADIPLPEQQAAGFEPVTQLAAPENDYPNCAPPPYAWHPPIYYPKPELYCPTGVVHRDWWREKTLGFHVNRRQRMLEKDYQRQIQYGYQTPCCPPHSCWGHSCDCCNGIGCRNSFLGRCAHGKCECKHCGCVHSECAVHEDHTSALEADSGSMIELAGFEFEDEPGEILLVSDEQPASAYGSGIETAGFCEVSDGCTQGNACSPQGHGYSGHGYASPSWCRHGHHCPLHRGHHCPLHGSRYGGWDECEEDRCHCLICCLKHRCLLPCHCLCDCLFSDGPHGWPRDIHPFGRYHIAYPVNPHHFDHRDGRIYAAQGYGYPIASPLAPNVEHTYNYSWGVPSSRLSPVSRMPGAPGVANPAGPAGPGVFPPAFPMPQWMNQSR
jgi:hypothetical protein